MIGKKNRCDQGKLKINTNQDHEGADEIQMRRVAGYMFGFMKQSKPKGVS